MIQPIRGFSLHLHLVIPQGGSEGSIVDSIPVAEVKVIVNGLVEFALSKILSVLGQLLVVKFFGDVLGKIIKVCLR